MWCKQPIRTSQQSQVDDEFLCLPANLCDCSIASASISGGVVADLASQLGACGLRLSLDRLLAVPGYCGDEAFEVDG